MTACLLLKEHTISLSLKPNCLTKEQALFVRSESIKQKEGGCDGKKE
jgi:hypothetical protein